jgi:hypothetical protein
MHIQSIQKITAWGKSSLSQDSWDWLLRQKELIQVKPERLFSSFSLCPRKCPSVQPQNPVSSNHSKWNSSTLSRALFLHEINIDQDQFKELFLCADHGESIDLYLLLPSVEDLPRESKLRQLQEGLRSNSTSIFEACAMGSAWPSTILENDPWNQMVLKTLFLGLNPLHIPEQASRKNPDLDQMLLRFASERAFASRSIPEELWSCFSGTLKDEALVEIQRLIDEHPNKKFCEQLKLFI